MGFLSDRKCLRSPPPAGHSSSIPVGVKGSATAVPPFPSWWEKCQKIGQKAKMPASLRPGKFESDELLRYIAIVNCSFGSIRTKSHSCPNGAWSFWWQHVVAKELKTRSCENPHQKQISSLREHLHDGDWTQPIATMAMPFDCYVIPEDCVFKQDKHMPSWIPALQNLEAQSCSGWRGGNKGRRLRFYVGARGTKAALTKRGAHRTIRLFLNQRLSQLVRGR